MDASKRAGGLARAAKLSPDQRREIARTAALARWGKPRPPKGSPRPPWLSEALWAFAQERAAQRGIEPMAWLVRCVEDARKRIAAEAEQRQTVAVKAGAKLSKPR